VWRGGFVEPVLFLFSIFATRGVFMALPIRSALMLTGKSADRFMSMAEDVRKNQWRSVDFSKQTKFGKEILKKAKI
jgi:hypothetical protein